MPLTTFHPTIQRWFRDRLGEPSAPQRAGWPAIRGGAHTLIAAPTGSGKTLAAFLTALDGLLRAPEPLPDKTRVLYVSPLKALGNDVQKNLQAPLAELRELDPALPAIRVLVRTGDTPAHERAAMGRRPPHILVTTPESLYLLLTSDGGRALLRDVRTVIVDEIHAVLGDKRGAHLALSLERLEALTERPPQRIGLSATQKPLAAVGAFLVGTHRDCTLVDQGALRALDLGIELPSSPLETVCSHETWQEIYTRMAELIEAHRTTLVFVNTRKMAERVAAQLSRLVGPEQVACHHGSLSRERRLAAEQRLKHGQLRALVATASLELGIDIGEVDLVIQVGATRSIATLLQRVGRSGHGLGRTPKGRLNPLTRDELVEAVALLSAIRRGELDRTPQPRRPLDILAQQIVAACVPEAWNATELFERLRRAWPYRELTRAEFDAAVELHTGGRRALLHRDGVHGRLRATRRARLTAITSGGAIPDAADYRVIMQPEEIFVGTLNEDFAVESNAGDIVQLGNASWRILKVEPGVVRVADAQGAPPTLPFWLGEAPARSAELSDAVSRAREAAEIPGRLAEEAGVPEDTTRLVAEYIEEGRRVLGAVPTRRRIIAERFFDESGGMQLVIHAPLGSHINKAWGLALRKRFCRGFGFELQAAANDEAILLSLGPQHSFPLQDVFNYLRPETARDVLIQALLATPLFETRWRWNVARALLVPRFERGRRLPAPLARMRAQDLLVEAFPEVLACGENLPPGDLPVPLEHPLVRQTIEDCLEEAMDVEGFLQVLREIRDGTIETLAIDTPTPSAFAHGILNAQPYSFLDDAPLEERRTQAVLRRRGLDHRTADELGELDPAAVARVREEAWPDPRDAEEVHEALLWMGYVTDAEAAPWRAWLDELAAAGRALHEGDRWYAAETERDPRALLRGRLEALGPVFDDDPLLAQLEADGHILRVRLAGRQAWCDRRLLARIQRYTLDRLRREIEPCTAAQCLRFLAAWQHVTDEHRLEGPAGVAAVLDQLAGFEAPVAVWERAILPARVRDYQRDWLDQLTLTGEFTWGRLWGSGNPALRATPICFLRREHLGRWLTLAAPVDEAPLGAHARRVLAALRGRGALFHAELMQAARLLPEHFEAGLAELIARGLLSCDSFGGLRLLTRPRHRRRVRAAAPGRWALFRPSAAAPEADAALEGAAGPAADAADEAEFVARQLLRRYGLVFRRLLERERIPVPWRDLVRVLRRLELAGDVRGGRFVGGFSGEQYALPEAVALLRGLRRQARSSAEPAPDGRNPSAPTDPTHFKGASSIPRVSAADPLNLAGILTPAERIAPTSRRLVDVV